MKNRILKSILGKFLCDENNLIYCHISEVIIIEDNKAIVSALITSTDNAMKHWFIETAWRIDDKGTYSIKSYKILREDVVEDGYDKDTTQDQAL